MSRPSTDEKILRLLRETEMRSPQIRERLGLSRGAVANALHRLFKAGRVHRETLPGERGYRYWAKEAESC